MASAEFEIIEAEWPDDIPPPQKAIQNYLNSGMKTAVITGPKDFLVNVRRAAKKDEYKDIVEVMMRDNQMHIRRKGNVSS